MTFYVENEIHAQFDFNIQTLFETVATQVLDMECCPYETEINLVITDNAGIREINKNFRNIDKETDVLSFPNIPFETEGVFEIVDEEAEEYFNPDTGELVLGDIMISKDKVLEQAEAFGHSVMREMAFLIAHSMLHLCGYDHMTEEEAKRMEVKQEFVLQTLHITRD